MGNVRNLALLLAAVLAALWLGGWFVTFDAGWCFATSTARLIWLWVSVSAAAVLAPFVWRP